MLEKMEVGKDAKECFAEMGEYRKMQDRLRGQMMQLDSLEVKKSVEKFRNRYCKATFHEITEQNGFKSTFERIIFSFTCAPLDHSLTLKKTHILQFLNSCFRHFAFAPARGKIGNRFIFDFGLVLLGSHLNITSLSSGATRGVNGCHKQLGSVNLNLTVARSQKDKTLEVIARVYMVSDGNFVITWKIKGILSFSTEVSSLILPRVFIDS